MLVEETAFTNRQDAMRQPTLRYAPDRAPMNVSIAIEVAALEVVAGFDGLLGGKPEPALVLGAYAVGRGQAVLLDRAMARFLPKGRFPLTVSPVEPARLGARLVSQAEDLHFVLLVLAFEEDGGKDVRAFYGALEHPHELSVFASTQTEVSPLAVGEIRAAKWPLDQATPVDLLAEGSPASSRCSDDTFIGASVLHLSTRRRPATSLYRLPFRTADRRNDWTAFLRITH